VRGLGIGGHALLDPGDQFGNLLDEMTHVPGAGEKNRLPVPAFALGERFEAHGIDHSQDIGTQHLGIVVGEGGVRDVGQAGIGRGPLQGQIQFEAGLNIAEPLYVAAVDIADQFPILLHELFIFGIGPVLGGQRLLDLRRGGAGGERREDQYGSDAQHPHRDASPLSS
jgi:hypothetical protein